MSFECFIAITWHVMKNQKTQENTQKKDTKYPFPPFVKQQQSTPGVEKQLKPKADHGEHSYVGNGILEGKVAIITGGDSGIGKAIVIALAREGADIVISYLSAKEQEDAKDSAMWVKKAGRKAILIRGDIRKESQCEKIIAKTIAAFGKIDILINNAAFQMAEETLVEIPTGEWLKTFDTNIHPMFYLSRAAEKHMPYGSSIINTTSSNAYNPSEVLLPYAATKAAIQNFTANLSQILLMGGKGIRVNAVAPGPIWTPLITSTIPDCQNFGQDTPMGRPGQPVEVAPAYVFLASDRASYISGITIPVAGGRITF